jgi:hypothetical protein
MGCHPTHALLNLTYEPFSKLVNLEVRNINVTQECKCLEGNEVAMGKLCANLPNNLIFEYIWPLILKIHPWKDQIGYIHSQKC